MQILRHVLRRRLSWNRTLFTFFEVRLQHNWSIITISFFWHFSFLWHFRFYSVWLRRNGLLISIWFRANTILLTRPVAKLSNRLVQIGKFVILHPVWSTLIRLKPWLGMTRWKISSYSTITNLSKKIIVMTEKTSRRGSQNT